MRKPRLLTFAAVLLALTACGGGGGGGSSSGGSGGNPPPTPNADPGGLWVGTISSTEFNDTQTVLGIAKSNGDVRFINVEFGAQYFGSISVTGDSFSGNLTAVVFAGDSFADGSSSGAVSIEGSLTEASTLTGSYSGVGDEGTFELEYSSLYERGADLTNLLGDWQAPETIFKSLQPSLGASPIAFSISGTGALAGIDLDGCDYDGSVSVPDASVNIYDFEVSIANCGSFDGFYTGSGVLADDSATNDTAIVAVSDGNISIVGEVYVSEPRSPSGIWRGTLNSPTFGAMSVIGIVAESGDAQFFSEATTQIGASADAFSDLVRLEGTAYAPFGTQFVDGSVRGAISARGLLAERASLFGTYAGVGETGTFDLFFDDLYLRDSSISAVAGVWSMPSPTGTGTMEIDIDSSGQFSGTDGGCTFIGSISIIDANFNAYSLEGELASCGNISGEYTGLGALGDFNVPNDRFYASIDNSSTSLWAELVRN